MLDFRTQKIIFRILDSKNFHHNLTLVFTESTIQHDRNHLNTSRTFCKYLDISSIDLKLIVTQRNFCRLSPRLAFSANLLRHRSSTFNRCSLFARFRLPTFIVTSTRLESSSALAWRPSVSQDRVSQCWKVDKIEQILIQFSISMSKSYSSTNRVGIGIGTVFAALISSYARNPSLKQQLFSYAILVS